eukprot:symbB.v1.2.031873.t2/scaffold3748.1/size51016/1
MGKFSISDALGNAKAYYDERIRLALYYCKASEFVDLELSLAKRLEGLDPRSGRGALAAPVPPAAEERQHLCIFVPSSARKERFVKAAEEAWKIWGTNQTYFVSKNPLSLSLDGQTFLLETDIDTDYAHLPVRTFLLFEALGRPEWVSACDWYMKADADSFLNVPLIEQRLRCFDPAEFWFLGVPQVAHSTRGVMTRFASGGAGYMISRALLPKLAAWSPFCLLQLLQHAGGTGMEDVSLAGCIWKWGRIEVVSYADYETEIITSEAALNRSRVAQKHEDDEPFDVPPCAMVVHSVTVEELPVVQQNIHRARRERPPGAKCIPDPARLAHGASMVLLPDTEEMPQAESYQWLKVVTFEARQNRQQGIKSHAELCQALSSIEETRCYSSELQKEFSDRFAECYAEVKSSKKGAEDVKNAEALILYFPEVTWPPADTFEDTLRSTLHLDQTSQMRYWGPREDTD